MIEKLYAGKAGLSIFRFKSLLVCCAAFLCVASCDNPEKKLDEVDAEVSVNVESLEFGWEGGSQTLEITANQSWTVSGPEWLKFEPSKGEGNATVTVTADKQIFHNLHRFLRTVDRRSFTYKPYSI